MFQRRGRVGELAWWMGGSTKGPVGWGGGVPTGAGLVDGGVDQGPWLQERVGGGGAMAVPKKGLGLGWLFQGRGQGRVAWRSGGRW